uniref:Uncharacterized protein LOC100183053 n=1 Tax=Phallusia mammillata TaxID=59560 RepID=A0A6F9DIF6_9ASCI|nr:uncharacterized protein LOC100183053 [Phallusia mammillata]
MLGYGSMSQIKLTRERACEILKVDEGIGFDAIKHAYRKQLMKWLPKRHNHSSRSIHNSLEAREAYKYLVGMDDDDDDIWATMNGGSNSIFRMKTDHGFILFVSNIDDKKKEKEEERVKVLDTTDEMSLDQMAEKAEKAAAELINEENKEKTKADKRRQKKLRQKIRKRQAKKASESSNPKMFESSDEDTSLKSYKDRIQIGRNVSNYSKAASSVNSVSNGMSSTSFNSKVSHKHRAKLKKKSAANMSSEDDSEIENEEPGWDKDSAFFTKVAQNSKIKQKPTPKVAVKKEEVTVNGEPAVPANVIESRKFAMEGNKKASALDYRSAIELFTKAIFLYNRECKYFGNRAYCYEKMGNYGSALDDANTAISLSPDWPKGHFRKGKALIGLKELAEAEASFEQVLKIDRSNKEAASELRGIQVQQLQNMGFSKELCEIALKKRGTVQLALDELLSGVLASASLQDVYVSDEDDAAFFEEEEEVETKVPQPEEQFNEVEYSSLWVGNITPDVTVAEMREYFSQFGELQNINTLYASRCAFINYKEPEPAKLALLAGDTIDVGETTLIIRYPDRAFEQKRNQGVIHQGAINKPVINKGAINKGAINKGAECHFWRNHGCHYGAKCRYMHVPEHRGIEVYGSSSHK